MEQTETTKISVGSVADFLADVNDDVLPDRYFEIDWFEASPAEYIACKLPDGNFFDGSGHTTVEQIRKRYRFGKKVMPVEVDPAECLLDLDDENGAWSATTLATFVINYLEESGTWRKQN